MTYRPSRPSVRASVERETRRRRRRCSRRVAAFTGEQRRVAPQRLAVDPPEDVQRPARQRLAGIPLALAVVQQRTGGEALAEAAPASWPASSRLRSPRAAVFHSAPSMSSSETKVGSPPWVRRTSSRSSCASTVAAERVDRLPVAVARTAWSRAGLRAGGSPASRDGTGRPPDRPVRSPAPQKTGTAEQASGMCPSPVSRPDVGSRPIQPAPGM